jgi:hypothetical protein
MNGLIALDLKFILRLWMSGKAGKALFYDDSQTADLQSATG